MDEELDSEAQLLFQTTALPRLIESLAQANPGLIPAELEAVQHLPIISNGPLFAVKEHIRGAAMGRDVVLKIFKRSLSPNTSGQLTIAEYRRILREITILSFKPFLEHDNIVTLENLVFGIHCGDPFEICPAFVLERASCGNLEGFQRTSPHLDWSTRKALCFDVAAGLQALHANGILHGDMNPAHILVFAHPERNFIAKLTGFGETLLPGDSEQPLTASGTEPFVAPEVREGLTRNDQLLKTDIFTLGLLLWSILVHRDAFLSFDLPLDINTRNEHIKDIIALPFLYRFIPLLIEHEAGPVQDNNDFYLLQSLFECTVRISPRLRDLKLALQLLHPHSGRSKDSVLPDVSNADKEPMVLEMDLKIIKASTTILKELPFHVTQQYIESLEYICHNTIKNKSHGKSQRLALTPDLASSAAWALFLCHLQGYGTQRKSAKALEALRNHHLIANERAILANLLLPVLHEALNIDISSDDRVSILATSLGQLGSNGLGPWMRTGVPPATKPTDHGLKADQQLVRGLCATSTHILQESKATLGSSNTLLHAAAFFGMTDEVRYLVEQGINIDALNDFRETSLFIACKAGHVEVAKFLLDHGADASIDTDNGENGLHWLCSFSDESGLDIAVKLFKQNVRIGFAVFKDLEELEWIPVTPDMAFLRDGRMPGDALMRAIANRDIPSIQKCLGICRIYISMPPASSRLTILVAQLFSRPLRLACELHLDEVLELLCHNLCHMITNLPEESIPSPWISNTRQLEHTNSFLGTIFLGCTNSTALLRAAIETDFEIARLSYHKRDYKSACRRTLSVLAEFGLLTTSVDTRVGQFDTLAYTIQCGNEEALSFFLEIESFRGNIDSADLHGFTPVHHALKNHRFEALVVLAKHGATLDLRKGNDPRHCLSGVGASYLHVLASLRIGDPSFVNLFLENGVPATVKDNRGLSALNLALKRGAFALARILTSNGADILEEGIFGSTALGELFLPGQADQHDDLFATFKFLLSYEARDGKSLFITRREIGYTILHTVAAYYSPNDRYAQLLDILIRHYGLPEHINAKAKTPARSTALHIAIAMHNPIVVKAVVEAGASVYEKDRGGRTALEVAQEMYRTLVYSRSEASATIKSEKLERAVSIILILAKKSNWPAELKTFPELIAALDQANILLGRMKLSIHKVAEMRKLEAEVLHTINTGMEKLLPHLGLDGIETVRRVIERRVRPTLRVDIEFRVLPNIAAANPSSSFETLRETNSWCKWLSNARLQDLQQAAAFEWFLDQVQQDTIPKENVRLNGEDFQNFISTPVTHNLPLDSQLFRYPDTLLGWYEKSIRSDEFVLDDEDRQQVQDFVEILRDRETMRARGLFPLPIFSDGFLRFHFDLLQPEKLDAKTALATILIVTRCRCYLEDIGLFSPFDIMRLCQRMTSIDDETWAKRLNNIRIAKEKDIDELTEWKRKVGIEDSRSIPFSIMKDILTSEKLPDIPSILMHPEYVEAKNERVSSPALFLPSSAVAPPDSNFPYQPLDFGKNEVRLLKLMPSTTGQINASSSSSSRNDVVECTLEHFSLSIGAINEDYRIFLEALDTQEISPHQYHQEWRQKEKDRFNWGDFSCLSYTWGDPKDQKKILLNSIEVSIGANLEAALRALRDQDEFRKGLLLWADALCINQSDLSEKEKVVGDMQNLYVMADRVTVWLGAGNQLSEQTMTTICDFVRNFSDPSEGGTMEVSIGDPPPLWSATTVLPAIVDLMDRPYWRRLWIMQEITACAPCEHIYLGPHRIEWKDLAIILQFQLRMRNSRDLAGLTDEFTEETNNRVLENVKQAVSLVNVAEAYRYSRGLGKQNQSIIWGNWSTWIYLGSNAQVTDQRDRIYGLLGLLPDTISSKIRPNYSKSVGAVFCDLSRAIVEATGSFDEIFVGNFQDTADLPSWALDLRDTGRPETKNGRAGGCLKPYSEFLESRSLKSYMDYDIPDGWKPRFSFSTNETLTVRAIHVHTVAGTSGSAIHYTSPIRVFKMDWKQSAIKLQTKSNSSPRETLLQVMCADPQLKDTPDTSLFDIPFYSSREPDAPMIELLENNGWADTIRTDAFRLFHNFRLDKANFVLFEGKTFGEYFTDEVKPSHQTQMMEMLRHVKSVISRTFITTENGALGSTAVAAKEGDRVYVIPGCSYPVIIRLEGQCYRVVGECYVDGIMNGEAFGMVEAGVCAMEDIALR